MTRNSGWRESFFDGYEQGRLRGNARRQRTFGAASLACIACACAWILWANLARSTNAAIVPASAPAHASAAARALAVAGAYAKLSAGLHDHMRRSAAITTAALFFDAQHPLGFAPAMFVKSAPLIAEDEPAAPDAPLELASTGSIASGRPAAAAAAPAKPSIFERLFGKPAPVTLAYAASEDADVGGPALVGGRYDRYTAVYDISAHTVYMPDGSKLEAHSGLGSRLDDPRHTDEHMRGATPATVYDLEPRESLFHGVRALRLIPVDDDKVFGRSGLLAHTFMLGPNGDSNGCVSFRNYDAFLQAYLRHEVKRLAVVTRVE